MDYAGLKTPGVYINEISTLPASIVAVDTAIPAFIGYPEKMMVNGVDILASATTPQYARISSMKEYEDIFGGAKLDDVDITVTIKDHLTKKATTTNLDSRLISAEVTKEPTHIFYYQMQMFFANGGGPCYIIAAAPAVGLADCLVLLKTLDEPTLIVFPDGSKRSAGNINGLYELALTQCEELKDRFVLIDVLYDATKAKDKQVTAFRDSIGASNLKYGAAYYPHLKTRLNYVFSENNVTINHIKTVVDLTPPAIPPAPPAGGGLAPVPPPPVAAPAIGDDFNGKKMKELLAGSEIYNQIKGKINQLFIDLPPSAAMAGVYAAVDNARGVWKAPANVGVNFVSGVAVEMNDLDQQIFNVDATSGKSVNVIRSFTGRGIVVWGARTLEGNSNEWRYISVRRFFNMVEESVKKALGFYVFEPNDANTWVKVKAGIENFLTVQWRAGALQGAKPEQAFFVSIGLNQTMSAFDILEGRMIIRIGMAVVRPAEFIILEFTHKFAEA
jgi:uncharacterized protein